MKGLALGASVIAALTVCATAPARSESYRASIIAPPRIQQAGTTYRLRVVVRNRGASVRPFCLDFTDDHNSWLIEMPGLVSYDSDTFCLRRTLAAGGRRTLTAYVIPAKAGAHVMKILIGKAQIFKQLHDAIITDNNALEWSQQFVIVS
jgi:hypothetical protein